MDALFKQLHDAIAAVGEIPQNWWVIFVSVMLSFVGTQWVKYLLPLAKLSDRNYRVTLRLTATLLAAIPCAILWQGENWSAWVALLMGVSSPVLYKLATYFLYKRWPQLEKVLSGQIDDSGG